ncbi:MAG TPA: DUF4340 domain-containing protein [Alphaproteobacteria bacterium]|nr:DUF4340 domain-containing protein [Alphaproteobacteria bacterium]
MKNRTLAVLAAVTVVVIVGAVIVNTRKEAFTTGTGGAFLLPDFAGKLNDAAKIVVASGAGSFTIVRGDKNWTIAEKYGYPAKYDVVKSLLLGLAELKTVEAKTAEPSLYPQLEVEDVASGAKSAMVTVEDAKGATLASVIIGKERFGRGGDNATEVYVRKAGDKQSWLATGSLQRNDDVKQWMRRDLVSVDRERVREVDVTPAGDAGDADKPYQLTKEKAGEGDFALEGVPPDDKVKAPYEVDSIAGALGALSADDVLPAANLRADAKPIRKVEFKTFDGLSVVVQLYLQDGKTWAKIIAASDATAPGASAEQAAATASAAPTGAGSNLMTPDEVKHEIEDIDGRTKDWVFVLEPGDQTTLEKKFTDLIEPKDKAKPKS